MSVVLTGVKVPRSRMNLPTSRLGQFRSGGRDSSRAVGVVPTAARRLPVVAAAAALIALLGAAAALAAVPTITTAPRISGSVIEGQTLTVSQGTWSNSPSSYSFQWQRCSASAYSARVLADSPVGYWRLEETATTSSVADSSGSGNAGTYSGGVALGQFGAVADGSDRAAFLDGASGYARIPSSSSLSPASNITLEAWVKPSAGQFALQKPILVKGFTSHDPPYYQYGMFLMDSSAPNGPKNLNFRLALGGTPTVLAVNNSGWQYGVWNHVVGTYDGSTMRLYLNGNLIGAQAASGSISGYATPLDIGAYENLVKTSTYLFGGGVDEVAIYNTALSSSVVQQHHDAATVGTCSNVAGATSSTYKIGSADVGKSVRAVVTATNASGSTSATTDPVGPVVNHVVPVNMTFGGGNPAAPGACKCDQNAADPVDTARGGFSESTTDFNIATYGPPLAFGRTYDSQLAQSQAAAGTPGALGYGWTDNWNSSLATGLPTPSDIYRVAGSSSGTAGTSGGGGAATAALLHTPSGVAVDADGNVYLADTANNRVQEIAAKTHTQWGIAMTAGYIYTIAGSASGTAGNTGNAGAATAALLRGPTAVTLDTSGNLYVADAANNRIQEVAVAAGTQWGVSMTANYIYTVAGSASGTAGTTGDGGLATAALLRTPSAIALDSAGDLLIADTASNRVRAVATTTGTHWGTSMTANKIYTIVGSTSVIAGYTGDFGPASSALLNAPAGIAIDGTNNLYIADTGNNRVQEVPAATHTQYGIAMTANNIYTIAGDLQGTGGAAGNGGPATSALLQGPKAVAIDSNGNVYVADTGNNRLQEVAASSGEQWGQGMTSAGIYTVAGSAAGSSGITGDGGVATSALMHTVAGVSTDTRGNVLVSDQANNTVRLVASTAAATLPLSPTAGAVSVTLGTGSEVIFASPSGGVCPSPYVGTGTSGTYCSLPEVTASLTFDAVSSTYVFVTHPYAKYTFNSSGRLIAESAIGGDELTISYGSPSAGSGACPSTATSCDTVTSASGRTLTIARDTAGRVTSVIDPLGRSWTYAYCTSPTSTCSIGDLVSATDPRGNVTSYGYDETNSVSTHQHDIVTITKPNGQPGASHAGAHLTNAYDTHGRVDSQTDPAGNETTFDYSNLDPDTGDGYVVTTDPNGNQTKYEYSGGVLKAKIDGYGTGDAATWSHTPDPATLLDIDITDGLGNSTSATYDAVGNVASTTDALGSTVTDTYNAFDEPTCEASALATSSCSALTLPAPIAAGASTIAPPSAAPPPYVTYYEYDTDGNLMWSTVGVYNPGISTATSQRTEYRLHNGQSITIGSNTVACATSAPSTSLPCATIDANGVVTQQGYSAAGDLAARATPDGNPGDEIATTTYGYNADGERTSETKPNGNLTGATAANFTTSATYNATGDVTTVTVGHTGGGSVARTTTYGYDANRNRTSVTDARNKSTTYTFDADDQRVLKTDPEGNATLTCYDGVGNVTQSVPPVGVAANSLTPASCPTSYPSGYGTRLAVDATTYTYDHSGQKTQKTTPAPVGQTGHETTNYTYDVAGRLTSITAPPTSNLSGSANQVTTLTYDGNGQLLSQTTGAGTSSASTTSYCYDPLGETTAVVAPNGNMAGIASCSSTSPWTTGSAYETTYSYDSVGELVSRTRPATSAAPSGQTTSYTYDPAGNEATVSDPNGTTTTKTYTPLNQLTTVSYAGSSAHSVTYTYDASGNRLSMTDGTGTSSYTYDDFNELTAYQNGAGKTVAYNYDADGHVTDLTYPLGAGATWATTNTVSYGYDDAGALTSIGDFNGNTITIGNTSDSLPSSISLGVSGDTITTTYDPTDTPSQISLDNASGTLLRYAYSDVPSGAIATETDTPSWSGSPAGYSYDPQARVTSMTPGTGSPLSYGFDASGNLTTLPSGATGTYDHASELTSSSLAATTTSYTYDAAGRRIQASSGGTTIVTATYDGAGRLTSHSNSIANMTSASYDGDGLRQSDTTIVGSGSPVTDHFTWNPTISRPQVLMDSTNAYIYGAGIAPIAQVNLSSGAVSYLVSDLIGSARGIIDAASGNLTADTAYDAWGTPSSSGGLTSYTPFGYAGSYTDSTGLMYLVNRYYDPQTGQFLTVDPETDSTGVTYAYAGDNPIDENDPFGLCAGSATVGFKPNNDTVNGGIRPNCGDPESCQEETGSLESQAEASTKERRGEGQQAENGRQVAVAEGQLQSALRNPVQYRGLDYDYVYRKLVGDARMADWDVTVSRNNMGVVIHEPGTTAQIRIMTPSPNAPPGSPPSFYRLVVGKTHVNLTP